jgi:hypothetical protein
MAFEYSTIFVPQLGTKHADIGLVKGILMCMENQSGINMGYLMVSLVIEMYIFITHFSVIH